MLRRIKCYFLQKYVTKKDIAAEVDIPEVEAKYILDELVEKGLLIEIKPGVYISHNNYSVTEIQSKCNTMFDIEPSFSRLN